MEVPHHQLHCQPHAEGRHPWGLMGAGWQGSSQGSPSAALGHHCCKLVGADASTDPDKASSYYSLNVPKQVRQHNAGQDGVKKAGHKATLFSKHFYSPKVHSYLFWTPYEADEQLEADCVCC